MPLRLLSAADVDWALPIMRTAQPGLNDEAVAAILEQAVAVADEVKGLIFTCFALPLRPAALGLGTGPSTQVEWGVPPPPAAGTTAQLAAYVQDRLPVLATCLYQTGLRYPAWLTEPVWGTMPVLSAARRWQTAFASSRSGKLLSLPTLQQAIDRSAAYRVAI